MMKRMLIALFLIAVSAHGGEVVKRGATIPHNAKITSLAAVLENPNAYAQKSIVTEGVVESSCFFAGCWMKVAPAAGQRGMRVTFTNRTTIPRRSKGRHARMLGQVKIADGKAAFVASGVELTGGGD
jgi:hypothetical protein